MDWSSLGGRQRAAHARPHPPVGEQTADVPSETTRRPPRGPRHPPRGPRRRHGPASCLPDPRPVLPPGLGGPVVRTSRRLLLGGQGPGLPSVRPGTADTPERQVCGWALGEARALSGEPSCPRGGSVPGRRSPRPVGRTSTPPLTVPVQPGRERGPRVAPPPPPGGTAGLSLCRPQGRAAPTPTSSQPPGRRPERVAGRVPAPVPGGRPGWACAWQGVPGEGSWGWAGGEGPAGPSRGRWGHREGPQVAGAHLLCSSLMRTMRLRWPWEYCSMTSRTSYGFRACCGQRHGHPLPWLRGGGWGPRGL